MHTDYEHRVDRVNLMNYSAATHVVTQKFSTNSRGKGIDAASAPAAVAVATRQAVGLCLQARVSA